MTRFTLIFPEFEYVHLSKDVGMIPLTLHRKYGWQCSIASYAFDRKESEELPADITFDTIRHPVRSSVFNGCRYLLKNAGKIDVLMLFHAHLKRTYYYIWLYKLLNPQGKVYLKLDAPEFLYNDLNEMRGIKGIKHNVRNRILRKCTLISVESRQLIPKLSKYFDRKINHIPNGYSWDGYKYDEGTIIDRRFITAARLGSPEKNTELLLEAYRYYRETLGGNWKLCLAGSCSEEFEAYRNNFLTDNAWLANSIEFTGMLNHTDVLKKCAESMCFVLPSKTEASPLCLTEAISVGCYLIVSDKVTSRDEMTDGGKYGLIVKTDDMLSLAEAMKTAEDRETEIAVNRKDIMRRAADGYSWDSIVKTIREYIEQ